jgi:DNA-binding transcriptional regulator YdaS (Cro superfamily)
MTKGEFIDSVLLAVSGGNLSPDINITRQDIAARLAISLTSAVTGEVEAEKLMAARMKRVFGVSRYGLSSRCRVYDDL